MRGHFDTHPLRRRALADAATQEVDDVAQRRARREHARHADCLELDDVGGGDGAADRHDDVAGPCSRRSATIRGTSVMCAPDRIDRPTASASSWMTVSTICSGVWC